MVHTLPGIIIFLFKHISQKKNIFWFEKTYVGSICLVVLLLENGMVNLNDFALLLQW